MEIGSKLIHIIQFVNEYEQVLDQPVEYEWLPVKCKLCHIMGHLECDCKSKKNSVWQVKNLDKQAVQAPLPKMATAPSIAETQKAPNITVVPAPKPVLPTKPVMPISKPVVTIEEP